MGAAVAVADVDADGHPDLYVTNSKEGSKNRLYRNRGDGTFEDVAERFGVADLNRPRDRRVDGRRVRRLRQRRLRGSVPLRGAGPSSFTTTAGRGFTRVDRAGARCRRGRTSTPRCGSTSIATAGSICSSAATIPERLNLWNLADTKIMPESFEYANNGGRKYLYRNLGGGRFEEVSAQGRPELDALGAGRGRGRSARHRLSRISSSPTTTACRSSSSTRAAASAKSGARPASATRRRAA